MQELRFHHAALSVPDLDAAADWYCRVLGFAVERRFALERLGGNVVFLVNGANRIELFHVPGAAPMSSERGDPLRDLHTLGNKHCAFEVDDLDAFHDEVARRDADIAIVVKGSPAPFDAMYLRDCAGNLIEIVQTR